MSDTSSSSAPVRSRQAVVDPVPPAKITLIGVGYLLLAILLFYLLITTWPVAEGPNAQVFRPTNVFGFSVSWAPDRQMIFTVMMAGALGSLIHVMTSFGDYVGNRELGSSWLWYLALRVPIGIAIAVLFYFIVRGGILVPTIQGTPNAGFSPADTVRINPYGMAGFAALAGMFSQKAADKLSDVFDAMWSRTQPDKRRDALGSSKSITVDPATLFQGERKDLTITGSGFEDATTATINGNTRTFNRISATRGTVKLLDDDVKQTAKLELVITNPNKDVFKATIEVAAKPVISTTDVNKAGLALTVNGQGFKAGCTAQINGAARTITSVADSKIVLALDAADVATPGRDLRLAIKNPDGGAVETTVRIT